MGGECKNTMILVLLTVIELEVNVKKQLSLVGFSHVTKMVLVL